MGHFAVLEGLDGSGKATQAAMLANYLRETGKTVVPLSFPDYGSQSSALVRLYLSGGAGSLSEVNVYAASSFYAADRYISYATGWKKNYEAGHTIISDRYVTSNAAHQMSRLPKEEWDSYLEWMEDYEYNRLGLPRPGIVVYLDMRPEVSRRLIEKRNREKGLNPDIHERDENYLARCREAALYACDRLGWRRIVCDDGREPVPAILIAEQVRLLTMDV
ncbi:MAG: deoxynucleoside kinase [Oscillospiraceae bacterium]|jgi:dTMP kinase|nr:deoxynucleoside kinase [Oscillospiraceae bacterium]